MNQIEYLNAYERLSIKQKQVLDALKELSPKGMKLKDVWPLYYDGKQNALNAINKMVLLGLCTYDEENGLTYLQPCPITTANSSH